MLAVDMHQARWWAIGDFIELTKPRVGGMVLIATAVGFYLGSTGALSYLLLLRTLIGTGLAAAGTLALNQYLERELDARMERTCRRPLPSGRLQPIEALVFGAVLTAGGVLVLTVAVRPASGFVAAMIVVIYLLCYTPMKRRTPFCSVVGAIPGALPPVIGWVAAGEIEAGACVLFAILFLWQLPHSLVIAQLYAGDYARAGFRMLPIVDRDGSSTERQIIGNCAALLAVGLMPTLLGLTGAVYFVAALVLGSGFLICGLLSAVSRSRDAVRRLLLASLLYLPMLMAFMALDKIRL